jgi:hypothetical protein
MISKKRNSMAPFSNVFYKSSFNNGLGMVRAARHALYPLLCFRALFSFRFSTLGKTHSLPCFGLRAACATWQCV